MNLLNVIFHHFRSFGREKSSIEFDKNITFFVGKNHTGKSNLMKFLEEIKLNKLPFNNEYILKRHNWFNNESGIDRPLKFRYKVSINDKEYEFFCKKWFLEPLIEFFKEKNLSKELIEEFFSYKTFKDIFPLVIPEKKIYLRMEFIRLSDKTQNINYSIQFNNLIVIQTGRGRNFIQTILPEEEKVDYRPHETTEWKYYLGNSFITILKKLNVLDTSEFFNQLHNKQDNLKIKEIAILFHQKISKEVAQFSISTERAINEFYKEFLDKIMIFRGRNATIKDIQNSRRSQFEELLAQLLCKSINESIYNQILRRKLDKMHQYFESIYESLDLTYAIENIKGRLNVIFYKRKTNTRVQNFDSLGTGISNMLYFLYKLTIEEGNIIFIDSPEENLHPHNQRYLYNLIKEYSTNNQIILATNSPFFIQPDDLFQLRLFDMKNDETKVRKLNLPRKSKDYIRLKRNFDLNNRDAVFADGIVFVEGPTEEWAFPLFFRNFGLDLDLNNLSLIDLHGKGGFAAYWKFAHQLEKKFWFFFDYDVLGVKAGDEITPKTFRQSVIFKKRYLISQEVAEVCEELLKRANDIEFHEQLEFLRRLLEKYHIFVFPTDFEEVFETHLMGKINMRGSKVDKAIQLVDYLKNHENEQLIPDRLYYYIEIIQDELRSNKSVHIIEQKRKLVKKKEEKYKNFEYIDFFKL